MTTKMIGISMKTGTKMAGKGMTVIGMTGTRVGMTGISMTTDTTVEDRGLVMMTGGGATALV